MKSRGEETLLMSILDPNREVNPLYHNYIVLTLDGRVHSGMIVDEGATSMTLRKSEGATTSILRVEIEEVKNTGMSLMPDGFEDAMDHQAIADLIAYLMNQ
jgi:putative heme-binding domain-containing protein